MRRVSRQGDSGFTLLEMMVVISILLILLSIAMPIYRQRVIGAREDALRQNVETLNKVIAQYTLDKKKPPRALEDLHQAGYIKAIPEDITGRTDTWVPEEEDWIMSPEQTETGIVGVHSGSNLTASDGSAYSSW